MRMRIVRLLKMSIARRSKHGMAQLKLVAILFALVTLTAIVRGQCPVSCRCSEYARKTLCTGSCESEFPSGVNVNSVDFSATSFNITVLHKSDLERLKELTDLHLEDNNIFRIDPDAFQSLANLALLNLRKNSLHSLDVNTLLANNRLVYLDLSENANLHFPQSGYFLNAPSLEALFLENCRQLHTKFDEKIGEDVQVLNIGVLTNLINLKEVSFKNSGLDILEADVSEESFGISTINFKNNFLTTVPLTFFKYFTALETLYLDNNRIDYLPTGVFDTLMSLKKLFLNNNNLENIDVGLLSNLVSLEILDLSENEFAALPDGVFSGLEGLKILKLDGNLLKSVSTEVLRPLKGLTNLDMSGNKFQSLTAGDFSGLSALKELVVADSSGLTCDCGLLKFKKDLPNVKLALSCANVSTVTEETLAHLSCDEKVNMALVIGVPAACALAVVLVVGVVLACVRRRGAKSREANGTVTFQQVALSEEQPVALSEEQPVYAQSLKAAPRAPPRRLTLVSEED
uniref:Uncharacterized protein n=1 Tax=Timema shepardi TaxID=629360 RepID=A0A7R9AMH9_TIMSH|nr:unnamed protein product [Timema shepardi]